MTRRVFVDVGRPPCDQVERTRGQAFEAGYSAVPRVISRKSSAFTTRVEQHGDSSGKSHPPQKKRPKSLPPPSASPAEEDIFLIDHVDGDNPCNNSGTNMQTSGCGQDTTGVSDERLRPMVRGIFLITVQHDEGSDFSRDGWIEKGRTNCSLLVGCV